MSCELPYRQDFPTARTGRTFRNITYAIAGPSTLTVVDCVIKNSSGTDALTLSSSTSGITLTSGDAGAWAFSVDQIDAVSLTSGFYTYEITLTSSDGTVDDWFVGEWKIND